MLNNAITACQGAAKCVWSGITNAASKAQDGFKSFGRKVEDITRNHFPKQLGQIAKEAYYGAPYTAALALTVPTGFAVVAAAASVFAMAVAEEHIKPQTAKNIYLGIRNFCVLAAGIDTALAVATMNPFLAVTIPLYLALGLFAHKQAQAQALRPGFNSPATSSVEV